MSDEAALVVVFPTGRWATVHCQPTEITRLIAEYERDGAIEIWQGSRLVGGSATQD